MGSSGCDQLVKHRNQYRNHLRLLACTTRHSCPLGTTKATDRPYYAYGSQSHGMRKGGSAPASGPGRSAVSNGGRDPNAITYTKTFEIRHADSDEQSLVQMELDQFGPKKQKNPSSSTSISSL